MVPLLSELAWPQQTLDLSRQQLSCCRLRVYVGVVIPWVTKTHGVLRDLPPAHSNGLGPTGFYLKTCLLNVLLNGCSRTIHAPITCLRLGQKALTTRSAIVGNIQDLPGFLSSIYLNPALGPVLTTKMRVQVSDTEKHYTQDRKGKNSY